MKNITISEYGYIGWDKELTDRDKFVGNRQLTEKEFKELEEYRNQNEKTEKVFTRINSKCIKATNYVGIIQTKSLSIEILPKIYDNKNDENNIRIIFIEMLKPLLDINEVQINKANLSTTKNKNIYEMFITLFVQSMDKLIHKGIKSDYILQEGNQFFLKGKLKFNQHIKENYIHKERFYVETDEYLQDRIANRLLKSTIALLLKKTNDYDNKRKLRQQLFIFDEVQLSHNHKIDFKKVNKHRGMEHYNLPLRFAEVFLMHKSFTSMRGKDNVFALLFPMEKVFENYMEFVLNNSKEVLGIEKVNVNGFGGDWFLSDVDENGCNMVNLQPDYLLEMKNKLNIVTDAKWKLLDMNEKFDENCDKVNLSVGDIYQIFSYLNYYKNITNTAYLFVPKVDNIKKTTFKYNNQGNSLLNKKIKIIPIYLKELVENNHILNKAYLKLVKEKI
jgi:5-methylcytosine-specific restriction enzyme subunit McrC